jgi:hypothetical protein
MEIVAGTMHDAVAYSLFCTATTESIDGNTILEKGKRSIFWFYYARKQEAKFENGRKISVGNNDSAQ